MIFDVSCGLHFNEISEEIRRHIQSDACIREELESLLNLANPASAAFAEIESALIAHGWDVTG